VQDRSPPIGGKLGCEAGDSNDLPIADRLGSLRGHPRSKAQLVRGLGELDLDERATPGDVKLESCRPKCGMPHPNVPDTFPGLARSDRGCA